MKDWWQKRQANLSALTLSVQIMAYLATLIILISTTAKAGNSFYSYAFLLVAAAMIPASFFYLGGFLFMNRIKDKLFWHLGIHILLFAVITVVLSTFDGELLWFYSSIYIIPVVLSSLTLGKWWGMAFATAATGSIFWLSKISGNYAVEPSEAVLVPGSVFVFLAWLLSGMNEVEKKTMEKVHTIEKRRINKVLIKARQEHSLIFRIMETSPAGIIVLDRQKNLIYANTRIEQIFRLTRGELPGLFVAETTRDIPSCLEEVFYSVLITGEPVYNYQGTTGPTEKKIFLSVSGTPIFSGDCIDQVVLTVDDITIQKKMSEEMFKADKLESLGLLTSGIVHDFNNYLTAMLGNISLIKIKNKNEKITENLKHMEKAAVQARDLTRKLSVFAKGDVPAKKTLHVPKLLYDTVGFTLSGLEATYEIEVQDGLLPLEADETQIGQVISNILINAVQAMPQGGRITLNVSNKQVTENKGEGEQTLAAGEYVCIKISDEGTGIPQELMGKIFDPFFSTKTQGSGLGLATSYAIIRNHGGLIQVESQVGSGTSFHIYLPASEKPCSVPLNDEEKLYFGKGRVLVMDDDESILKTCGNMLKYLGYSVSFARDGLELVRRYGEAAKTGPASAYNLVIMDLTIPGGVGGKEAIELLKQLDSKVKAIVSSGYHDSPLLTNYQEYGFSASVRKPYRINELSKAIKEAMEDKSGLYEAHG